MLKYALNGGSATINGRGILRTHPDRRLDLAACAVLGLRPYLPSIGQAVQDFHVSRRELVERIEAYRAQEGNGNGNGHAVAVEEANESEPDIMVGSTAVHAIIMALLNTTPDQRAEVARELGCDWVWDHLIMPCMRSNNNG
jgi:hypothetical protein